MSKPAGRYYSMRGNPKRPRGSVLTTADVRKIVRGQQEVKVHNAYQSDTIDNTGETIVSLCDMVHGSGESKRIAQEIRMKKLRLKGYAINTSASTPVFRVQIVKSKVTSLVSSDFNGAFNDDALARANYTVLYDRFMCLQASTLSGASQSFSADIDLRDALCKWDGVGLTDFAHGQLYIVLSTNVSNATPMTVAWGTTLFFHE